MNTHHQHKRTPLPSRRRGAHSHQTTVGAKRQVARRTNLHLGNEERALLLMVVGLLFAAAAAVMHRS